MVAPRFVGFEAWAFRRPRSGDVSHPHLGFLRLIHQHWFLEPVRHSLGVA